MRTKISHSLMLLCLPVLIGLLGCEQPPVNSYSVPEETRQLEPPAIAPNPMRPLPGMAKQAAAAGELTYMLPDGWRELPASGIRKATLQVSDDAGTAELSVLVFPGDVGGELANINRWREQIGLQAIDAASLPKLSESMAISEHSARYVTLLGAEQSIKGAILPFHGRTWFFKLMGPTATVQSKEAGLRHFLESVKLLDTAH